MEVPFARPYFTGDEGAAIADVVAVAIFLVERQVVISETG